MIKRFAALALLALAACEPQTEVTNRDVAQANRVLNSAANRSEFISYCATRTRNKDITEQQVMAAIMKVPVSAVPRTYCERMTAAVASGRITAADLDASTKSGQASERIIAAIRG